MKRKVTTTTEEFDQDGILKSRVVETTEEEDDQPIQQWPGTANTSNYFNDASEGIDVRNLVRGIFDVMSEGSDPTCTNTDHKLSHCDCKERKCSGSSDDLNPSSDPFIPDFSLRFTE